MAIGPAAVAMAALGLVTVVAAGRRRQALAVSRGRGASGTQVVWAVAVESVLLTLPAVLVATAAAIALIPAGPTLATFVAAGVVELAAVLMALAAAIPAAVGPATTATHDVRPVRRIGARRLVFESLVVAVAAIGAYLLRERGIHGSSAAGALTATDPLVAAVPALAGVAAGLVAVRLFPLPMALLARLAGARRDLVPVLAMRRATKGGGAGPVLIVLMATATIGAFSSAMLAHLDRSAEAIGWQAVGAQFRVISAAGSLPVRFDPAALPGVEATAAGYRATVTVGTRGPRFDLLAVDGVAYEEVVAGTSGDPHLPHELLDPGSPPIPVIVSPELAGGADAITPGETFSLPLEAHQFPARALVIREFVPILPIGGQWAFVSRDQLQALQPTTRLLPTTVFLRAPGATAESIRAALAVAVPGATLDSQAERVAAIRGSPTVGAVRTGIAAAGIVAGAYAALAVAAALALAGAARAIEVAHLRLLGLTRRQAIGLAVVEHGPTVVVALAAGVALGLGLFIVLRPGLGLADLLGSPIEISLAVDATQLGLVLAAILLLAAAGIGIGAAIQRTIAPAAALRRGFD